MFFFFAEVHEPSSLVDVFFDFKSNIINWLLLVGFIIYTWKKVVPPMLANRKKSIEDSIANAKTARQEAEAFLKEQETRIANAKEEAAKIVDEADKIAAQLKTEIEKQTEREIAEMQKKIEAALQNERRMMITEVREAAVKAAIELSRAYLEQNVSEEENKKLFSQFMQQIDTITGQSLGAPADTAGAPGSGRVGSIR